MKPHFGHEPGRLQLWLFGPGTGELVVVHVPPSGWLVIDGCASDWAVRFFEHMRALPDLRLRQLRPTHLLLSHPHQDHASGVVELIDWCFSQGHSLRLAAVPRPSMGRVNRDDLVKSVASGQALAALNSIGKWWRTRPSTKWLVNAGSDTRLGSGSLRFLSPEKAAVQKAQERSKNNQTVAWNDLASALLLRWQKTRLVLGSDLTNERWPAAIGHLPKGDAQVLKVAHHGSRGAQRPELLSRFQASAHFVCTPFARENLPRFADEDGAHHLLKTANQLHLTGLPHAQAEQANRPRRYRRSLLTSDLDAFVADDGPRDFPSSWVKISVDATGARTIMHGPGSVVVLR